MPISLTKKVAVIDLKKCTSEIRNFPDMKKYIGGIGLGLKLLETYYNEDPLIFSVGPLNGFFPFCSKTSIVLNDNGVVEDLYLGGSLSSRIRYSGVDAIVINGTAENPTILDINNAEVSFKLPETSLDSLGLPGKRALLGFCEDRICLDYYFNIPEDLLEKKFIKKNLTGLTITGNETVSVDNFKRYESLYKEILQKQNIIEINRSDKPSCVNCPMGCERSRFGEIGGNVLLHSLCACQYAEKIYSDIGVIFSCLDTLGYDYTHEDIEAFPTLVEKTLKDLT